MSIGVTVVYGQLVKDVQLALPRGTSVDQIHRAITRSVGAVEYSDVIIDRTGQALHDGPTSGLLHGDRVHVLDGGLSDGRPLAGRLLPVDGTSPAISLRHGTRYPWFIAVNYQSKQGALFRTEEIRLFVQDQIDRPPITTRIDLTLNTSTSARTVANEIVKRSAAHRLEHNKELDEEQVAVLSKLAQVGANAGDAGSYARTSLPGTVVVDFGTATAAPSAVTGARPAGEMTYTINPMEIRRPWIVTSVKQKMVTAPVILMTEPSIGSARVVG